MGPDVPGQRVAGGCGLEVREQGDGGLEGWEFVYRNRGEAVVVEGAVGGCQYDSHCMKRFHWTGCSGQGPRAGYSNDSMIVEQRGEGIGTYDVRA